MWVKQSTAITLKAGPFLDSTDGVTAETALTIAQADVRLTKNGGDAAQKNETASATHDENGWYNVAIDATDTNTLGRLQLFIHETGALPVWHEFMVVPANVWDSFFGADKLQVHTDELTSTITDSIVDAVWDEDVNSAHQTSNTAGKRLDDSSTTVASNLDAAVSSLNDLSAAEVNAEVLDVLNTDTFAEPGTGVPPATTTLANKISYLYKFLRNRVTTNSTTISVYNDDATTVGQQSSHSDNGSLYDRGEFGSG
jgi:hypothetical protein